jgi:hypothetical protein
VIHLKSFNEGFGQNLDEPGLREFCEMYLAYLMDEGFEVDISKIREDSITDYCRVKVYKLRKVDISYSRSEYDKFSWNSVKDQFIPFFKMLNNNYIIKTNYGYQVKFQRINGTAIWASDDNILNDDFSKNFKRSPLYYIEVMLYSEK